MLVQAGSRFLSKAESCYATTELEISAVAWVANKCKIFLIGLQNFQAITDHNPFIPILNSYCLDEIDNPRPQWLKTKLMTINLTARWCKEDANRAPDLVLLLIIPILFFCINVLGTYYHLKKQGLYMYQFVVHML